MSAGKYCASLKWKLCFLHAGARQHLSVVDATSLPVLRTSLGWSFAWRDAQKDGHLVLQLLQA